MLQTPRRAEPGAPGRRQEGPGEPQRGRSGNRNLMFEHLFKVCAEAVRRGDRGPAETLLHSYRGEVERLRCDKAARVKAAGPGDAAPRRDQDRRARLIAAAEAKAVRIGRLLATAPGGVEVLPTSDPPTAQTTVHARRAGYPLSHMRLSRRQERAANEIRDVFEALVRGMFARGRDLRRVVERPAAPLDPTEFLSERLARLRHDRYLPWVVTQQGIVARVGITGSPLAADQMSAVQLVISVLIDRVPLVSLERRFGVRHGTLGKAFRASPDAYADVVGRR